MNHPRPIDVVFSTPHFLWRAARQSRNSQLVIHTHAQMQMLMHILIHMPSTMQYYATVQKKRRYTVSAVQLQTNSSFHFRILYCTTVRLSMY